VSKADKAKRIRRKIISFVDKVVKINSAIEMNRGIEILKKQKQKQKQKKRKSQGGNKIR